MNSLETAAPVSKCPPNRERREVDRWERGVDPRGAGVLRVARAGWARVGFGDGASFAAKLKLRCGVCVSSPPRVEGASGGRGQLP